MPPARCNAVLRYPLATALATVLLFAVSPTAAGQAAADRAALEALRDTLPSIGDVAALDALGTSTENPTAGLIREGLILVRRGELGTTREPYDESLRQLERALDARSDWPWAWYALGLTRLAMWSRGFVVKATPYHGQGISYRRAAMDAFARAIKADSAFFPASNALAGLIVAMGHRRLDQDFVEPLRRAARVPEAPASVPLALFRLEYGDGRYGAALELLTDYLHRGGDSGVARLEQARALQALGRGAEAPAIYLEGLRQVGEDGRVEYRTDLAWVAADWELAEYDTVPLSQVAAWVTRFWQERDALALRATGERLAEHLRRWVFVHQKYLIHRPDDAPIHAEGQTWVEQQNPMENFGVIEAMVLNDLNASTPNFKVYLRHQWEIDDRGVIYLRHGPPTRTAIYPPGPPNESWQYDLPEGSWVFHFVGSRALGTTAATTLVAALPLQPEMLDSRGNLDPRYRAIASDLQRKIIQMRGAATTPNSGIDTTKGWDLRPGSAAASVNVATRFVPKGPAPSLPPPPATFHPEIAYREIERGRAAIAAGVTTDGFPQHYKEDLDAVVQVYGVGFGQGETRRVLAVFAVPGQKITPRSRPDGGPGVLYPVTLRLIAMDRERGLIRQLDTTRTFLSRDTLKGDRHLTGLVELTVPPGRYQVRTLVTVPGLDAATGAGRDSVEIPPSPRDLVLSDLILGRQESGLSWSYGGIRVPLNPLNTYPRGADAELFYEVGGLLTGTSYSITMAVRKEGDKPDTKPAVEAGFEFTATEPYQQVTRGLGLANLTPGAYLLQVTVTEVGSDRRVVRMRALNILK
jgi:tetratricopeptide (TPR) repeat protein